MKNKRHSKLISEGFNSALDLSGFGFTRKYRFNRNINNSWHNVGTFFSIGFNESTKKNRGN